MDALLARLVGEGASIASARVDTEGLPLPQIEARSALAALGVGGGADLVEQVMAVMSQSRRSETRATEAAERSRAAQVDSNLEAQREALERAREAAEDAGFWGVLGDIAAAVGIVVGVAGAAFTGGASLALAGLGVAAMVGSRFAPEIAQAAADIGIVGQSAVDELTMGLQIGFAVVGLACGLGAASSGSAIAGAVQAGTAVAGGGARIGSAVCQHDADLERIGAERAEHQASVAQEQREDLIELMRAGAQAWTRSLARFVDMSRAVQDASGAAMVRARA